MSRLLCYVLVLVLVEGFFLFSTFVDYPYHFLFFSFLFFSFSFELTIERLIT